MTETNDTLNSIRLLASTTSSNDNACADRGNSGELHVYQTIKCVNLHSALRLLTTGVIKMNIQTRRIILHI